MRRVVAVETLDHLPAHDPAAVRSRRDLMWVHRMMRTRSIVRSAWQALVSPQRAREPLRILELGAGDGSLLLGVARSLAPRWPQVRLTLLDRQDIVSPATLEGYAALGWTAQVLATDALAWADTRDVGTQGGVAQRWDLISTALFLHHFEVDALELLLAAIATSCDRFFAFEPDRAWLALTGSHLVGLLGANAVTREDAVLSVHAGFRDQELSGHWPHDATGWQLHEARAGLFSHCFSAWRTEEAR
ncbi:class I SAM-dependent methyltransferase [Azohydromonas lata]|uniref:class I SAM-dependent methyltransferase n=1 Tax=Azohydromonas lata TaxID=45677 RepID=UPI00082E0519|nr:class I SAM-dependent methyltransferase [Azohydromonas lata]